MNSVHTSDLVCRMFVTMLRRCLFALGIVGSGTALGAGLFQGVDAFDLPPETRVEVVGDALRINGLDTRIYRFRSNLDVEAIAAHFNEQWPQRMKRAQSGPWQVLSHRQGDYLVTVQIAGQDMGQTQGFIAATNLFKAAEGRVRVRKPDLPLLPRTEVLQDIEADDLGRRSRTLILLSEQSAAQNLEFYRAHFRSQGYAPITAGALTKGNSGGAMVLNRGNEQLNVAVAEQGGKTVVNIVRVQP